MSGIDSADGLHARRHNLMCRREDIAWQSGLHQVAEDCECLQQNEKLAALQRRLEEVTTMHQQATDENESLRVRPSHGL